MKAILFNLCLLVLLVTSCNKSPREIKGASTIPVVPVKSFTKVYLLGRPGVWGGGVCSFDWVMIREDSSSIVYHSNRLPAYANITNTPVWVNITFHDTTNFTHCWDDIVVDSLKF